MMYISKNAAPPLLCTSAGNLHTLPKPTADPTVAAIRPILDANLGVLAIYRKGCLRELIIRVLRSYGAEVRLVSLSCVRQQLSDDR